MRTILLTGSGGMVGRNILEHKKSKDYHFLAPRHKDLDLLCKDSIDVYLKKYKIDVVIHAAGVVGGISANIAQPTKFLMDNAYMGLNLISACFENGIQTLLNLASSCMYPRNAPNPLKEEMILQGELEPTNEGYALAKILVTKLCEYIAKTDKNFSYKTAIPCNLYGKYDKFESTKAHMIPAVIAKIHQAKMSNQKSVEIWGNGEARREFMFAEDLADFVFYALENFDKMPQNLNVGLGYDLSINEYYEHIARVLGYDGTFTHDLSKPSGMKRKVTDNTRLKEFGWEPKISLEDGILETYKYFVKEES